MATPNPKVRPIRKGVQTETPKVDASQPVRPDPVLPDKPKKMSAAAKQVWDDISPELEKNALLTKRDKHTFALYCENVAIAQAAGELIRANKSKYVDLTQIDHSQQDRERLHPAFRAFSIASNNAIAIAKEFGLSPRGRLGLTEGRGAVGVNHKTKDIDPEEGDDLF